MSKLNNFAPPKGRISKTEIRHRARDQKWPRLRDPRAATTNAHIWYATMSRVLENDEIQIFPKIHVNWKKQFFSPHVYLRGLTEKKDNSSVYEKLGFESQCGFFTLRMLFNSDRFIQKEEIIFVYVLALWSFYCSESTTRLQCTNLSFKLHKNCKTWPKEKLFFLIWRR